jgi:geranylgeranyl diphosphate synthase, type II
MLDLNKAIALLQDFAEAHPFPGAPSELYEPCSYILSLGGKRLRPALALMAADLMGAPPQQALHIGWAVELFHNFSLIHDDIMDAAPLRRGQPTVHTKWDLTTGILSGDVMLIFAYKQLAAIERRAAIPEVLAVFNRVAQGVCEGQQMDVNFERRDNVSIDEYIRMIELKTAVLLGGALEMGALAVGAPAQDAAHLYDFGRLAGIAFQIQDDLLDTYGDPATFGKQVGGDIIQNKKTLLVLKTLETAPAADIERLQAIFAGEIALDNDQKVAEVRAIFDRNGIPAIIEQEKKKYEDLAFAALQRVDAPAERKQVLEGMIAALLHRAQ